MHITNAPLHVIFGTGSVGRAVMQELLVKGKRVRVVNRSGKMDIPAGVEVLAGDASDPHVAVELSKDAAVVYNCTNVPYTRWPELFPPLQQGIMAGVQTSGAKLVVMENVYMYGPTGGKPLTEDLPYAATTRKGRTRARMAEALLAAHKRGDIRVAILLQTLGLFNTTMREVSEMRYEFEEPFILDASRFEQIFGMHATPLPEAIRTTLQWFRHREVMPAQGVV